MIPYKIHQIKNIETTVYAFRRYNPNIFSHNDYECVYEGFIEKTDKTNSELCEDLYYIFNMQHPKDFKGHSLSMSDVIELTINGHSIFYYCDMCGFTRIP